MRVIIIWAINGPCELIGDQIKRGKAGIRREGQIIAKNAKRGVNFTNEIIKILDERRRVQRGI